MESDSFAVRTALFFLGAGLLLALSVLLFTRTQVETAPYLVLTTESVGGLKLQSWVYYKGVEVGTVRDIGFADDDYDTVRILIDVDRSIPLGENTYARLSLRGITGEYDLTLDNDGELGEPLRTSERSPAVIPMRSEFIATLGGALEGVLKELQELSRNLQQLTDEENRDNIRRLLASVADTGERLASLTEKLDRDTTGLAEAVESFTGAMRAIQDSARSLSERTGGVEELIAAMDEAVGSLNLLLISLHAETLTDVDETLASLRTALNELSGLARELQTDPQRLLLGPPELQPGPGETQEGED